MASLAPSQASTGYKRRVFFVTDLGRDELKRKFAAAGIDFEEYFKFSEKNDEDAEFIIFDLNHLPKEWGQYIGKDRRSEMGVPINVDNRVPFFFLTLEPETGAGQVSEQIRIRQLAMRENMEGVGIEVKPGNIQQIVEQLRWFQCMLPFYKYSLTEDERKWVSSLAALAGKNKVSEGLAK